MKTKNTRLVTQRRVYKETAVQLSEIGLHSGVSSQDLLEKIVSRLHSAMWRSLNAHSVVPPGKVVLELAERMAQIK